jgi:hypothetical protein
MKYFFTNTQYTIPPGAKLSELFYCRTLRDNKAQSQLCCIRSRLYKKGLNEKIVCVDCMMC